MIRRLYVVKKPGFDADVKALQHELANKPGLTGMKNIRIPDPGADTAGFSKEVTCAV